MDTDELNNFYKVIMYTAVAVKYVNALNEKEAAGIVAAYNNQNTRHVYCVVHEDWAPQHEEKHQILNNNFNNCFLLAASGMKDFTFVEPDFTAHIFGYGKLSNI